jgi:hypothetical protein
MVSDEAKEKILAYQKQKQYSTLDETVDGYIIEKSHDTPLLRADGA